MKYVFSVGIGILWLICMGFGTADVWHQGWAEMLLLWLLLSVLCALFLGTCLVMHDAVDVVIKKFH